MQRPGDGEGRAAPWLSKTAPQVRADENEQAALGRLHPYEQILFLPVTFSP